MLLQSLLFVLQSVADILCGVFLLRFLMQWARVSFRNPIGQFVIAASDWAVRPARKLVPGLWGLDLPCLLLGWLVQFTYLMLALALAGFMEQLMPGALGHMALAAVIETVRTLLYVVFGVVIITAVMSWVNPYAPLAPLLNALARPFLAPLQRFIPPLGGVDLSPLVLIIVLQLLLGLLAGLRHGLFAFG